MIKRKAVTDSQKAAIRTLSAGGSIAHLSSSIRVRDKDLNPVSKLTEAGFYQLKYTLKILRKSKKFGYILNKAAVLKLNGNSVAKKIYKEERAKIKIKTK